MIVVIPIGFAVALSALEMLAAVLAKRSIDDGQHGWALLGAAVFLILFGVYLASLRSLSLTTVTVGWIVVSQFAAVYIDWRWYGYVVTGPRALAIALILIGCTILALPTSA